MPTYDEQLLTDLLLAPNGPLDALIIDDEVTSTNDVLKDVLASTSSQSRTILLAATHQTQGKGRSGRTWSTPPGGALTASIHYETTLPAERMTWIPLLAGLGIVTAIRGTCGIPAALKWPNDIVVNHRDAASLAGWDTLRKVGGILVERVGERGIIIGVGINVHQMQHELPVASATSLTALGARNVDLTSLLAAIVRSCTEVLARAAESGGDVDSAGLREDIEQAMVTLGSHITAQQPDGTSIDGVAQGLDSAGGLLVRHSSGEVTSIIAGDVHHLRLK